MNKRFFNQQNLTRRLRLLPVLFAMLLMPLSAWAQWETQTSIFYGVADNGLYAKDSEDATMEYVWIYQGYPNYYGASPADSGVKINVRNNDGKSLLAPPNGFTIKKVTLNYSNLEVTEGSEIYVRAVSWPDTTSHYTDPYLMTSGGTLDINLNAEGISSEDLRFLIFSNDDKAYSYILNSITIIKAVDYQLSIGDVPLTGANVNSETGAVTGMDGFYFTPAAGSTPATLTLENVYYGASLTGIVWSGSSDLKIQYSGNNTINTWSGAELNAGDDGYCIIAKNNTSNLVLSATNDASTLTLTPSNGGTPDSNNSRAAISGFSNVTLDSGWGMYYTDDYSAATATSLTAGAEVLISKGTPLGITVAGVLVTSGNKDDILGDGTVKYTPANTTVSPATPATLTLTNATIIPTTENAGIVYEGEADLTISLIGTNMVKGGGGCPAIGYDNNGAPASPNLTFTKGDTNPCTLQLEAVSTQTIDGFTSVINTGLYKTEETIQGEEANTYRTTITSTFPYDLWIGTTQVTSDNASNVLGDGKVSFTESVGADVAPTYTLTLNDATLTAPIKVGLANLTIDIQGTNSITTGEACIQNTAASFVPSLTFKSTSEVVGSLTLTDTDENGTNGVISVDFFEHFTINKKLALILLRSGDYTSNTYYFSAGEVHNAQLVPSYGVQVNDMQVYEGNSTNVLGDGKVSFDKSTHTLTLNNASGIETISTTLSTLDIDLVGSNSLYRESNGSIFESASGEAVTIKLKSTSATGSLTMEAPTSYGATLIGANVTLTPVDPIVLLSSDVTENKGTLVYGVSYGLTVAGVTVSNANASNVLGGATATVVFTPADNTASPATPATLTLNGADNLGTILSGLENLKVVINGDNAAVQVKANSAVSGNKNITFEGGTNGGTLAISAGDGGSVVSGFASVSYDGAYAAANVPFGYDKTASQQGYRKSHMMDDNSYLETLTITTVPHYPIWLYTNVTTSTQINNTNKNTLLGASGNVSFDGSNTLSLKNSVNCTARIVSGLSDLKISIDGDCIIESPDSGSVVRSINSSAPLTIEKASGASSASLKLAAVSFTAIKAFASLDYTGLILLSEGATYTSGALNDSNNQPLNEAIFTTGLKKPTLQMNYETDTYSFQNPNGGGTLKYSRYFANNEYPDEKNQVDNGSTTFLIFKNGRQYNDPLTVICEVWVEANGNSSDKLYACRLGVKDMTATYGGTIPAPEFLPKSVEGVTVSGYSLGNHEQVAATVTEGNITLTGAGRQELDAIFSLPDGVEYIKTSTTETPQASFYLDVKPEKPTLSKAAGTYAGTQTITVTNLTPNATAWYYTYEGEEPASPNAQAFPEGGVDISSSKTLAVYYRASYETETSTEYLYSETTKVDYTILIDPELKYMQGTTEVTTAEWTLGKDDNTALPVLQNTHSVAVTYASNNTDVATVATDGTVTVVGIGTAVITATSAATDVYAAGEASYTLTVKRQLNVSFSAANEWATYYASENLATPTGLVAYQVTAVGASDVTSSPIDYIPANTAILLKNVSGNVSWSGISASAYTGATSTFASNKLIGTASDVDVSTISGGTVYVLYNNMFKRATGGTIPANRGYLVVEPSAVNAGSAPQLSITIGDETTGIQTLNVERGTLNDDSWYTIDGRKVNGQSSMVNGQLKPGLYIKNGKKVVINKK